MAPPKKTVKKMDLTSFLNDDTFGSSWAEEDVDLNKITIPIETANANTIPLSELAHAKNNSNNTRSGGFGGSFGGRSRLDPALGGGSSDRREEYPVPDAPPYRAVINNIPWDITPEGVQAWVEDGLVKPEAVEEVVLPKNLRDPTRLKGNAFVTLKERADLVAVLKFNGTKLNERTVYVSVAAPRRGGGADVDWSSARGSNFQGDGREDAPDLDWGAARGSNFRGPRREREEVDIDWTAARGSNFQGSSRPPRREREEVDIDWSAARGSNFQGSSRPPRREREEPDIDWSAARGSNFQSSSRPPRREREEPDIDWSAARGSNFQSSSRPPRREREKEEPALDWGAARGAQFGKPQQTKNTYKDRSLTNKKTTDEQPKIQKSVYDVLRTEDDDEDEEAEKQNGDAKENKVDAAVEKLQDKTAQLTVEDGDDWEVVGKK
ncbi:Eukaryotic translation initiation factor 4B [Saccharomyces cerevisiae]|uniref:Translation initiation factor eIF4B n=1 Tax=Saccharomyces cerevisiae (strain YJM789) TaxID=307796 RepID=A6ZX39_YEAS7|nr:Tif3p [Saccharomyces cerevisiae YJM1460]AJV91811.1 Tif3p [Saccharomyces cerevisiae YJM1463]AJV92691.1 Tif3p [Saccharomyces cerevisiae YJM1478]AJV94535.1 Tif3p [Saccharomyces cerevisiae YJM1573]AJV95673.1 Tif3p [Saccharomyces cerevisiae YJM1615]AJV96797.1 Tif3p [Saccharomyces cerevisiae YJM195]AJV98989.1 Tif3p [Saccharomyces cerevisiae YJM320]AJV99429.1 Tif3p [Saccharomyces cerevisiae YJM326]AJV99850.1 Tif3p [Saccharomyces cerevisiae YJM428]AJW01159.1 Tif3p [Saccharomyces cerevisiae YJM1